MFRIIQIRMIHPILKDIWPSKNGLYETSTFGWLTRMFRIIRIRWYKTSMTYKQLQNHPDLDYAKYHFRITYRINLDGTNHSNLGDFIHFQVYRGESRHIALKFGWYFTTMTTHLHWRFVWIINRPSIIGVRPYQLTTSMAINWAVIKLIITQNTLKVNLDWP